MSETGGVSVPERVTDNSFEEKILQMQNAALDISPVSGLTHRFYRYPARFSPMFAATAIEEFSTPGDLVLGNCIPLARQGRGR